MDDFSKLSVKAWLEANGRGRRREKGLLWCCNFEMLYVQYELMFMTIILFPPTRLSPHVWILKCDAISKKNNCVTDIKPIKI